MGTPIYTEQSQGRQEGAIESLIQNINRRFDEQRSYMDKRFEKSDERFGRRFDELRSYMDDRFEKIGDRFEKIDDRFEKMDYLFEKSDDRADKLEESFDQLKGMFLNSKATSSWSNIYPIGVFNPLAEPGSRYRMPKYFPNKVVKFWHLQESKNHQKLIHLLHFYNIQGLERRNQDLLGDSDDNEGPPRPSESLPTLEQTIKVNPALGLSALAAHLGLDYTSINYNMRITDELRTVQAQRTLAPVKRGKASEEDEEDKERLRPARKLIGRATPRGHEHRPIDLISRSSDEIIIAGVPIKMYSDEVYAIESPLPLSHVGWAITTPPPGPKLRDMSAELSPLPAHEDSKDSPAAASAKNKTRKSSLQSKGSTVPFSHTPSVLRGRRGAESSRDAESVQEYVPWSPTHDSKESKGK